MKWFPKSARQQVSGSSHPRTLGRAKFASRHGCAVGVWTGFTTSRRFFLRRQPAARSTKRQRPGSGRDRSSKYAVRRFALAEFQADGSPIANFGNNGIVITRVGYNDSEPSAVTQPDGTILLAGTSSSNPGDESVAATQPGFESSVLIRYNADGSLDQSFGDGGILTTASPRTLVGFRRFVDLAVPHDAARFRNRPSLGNGSAYGRDDR